MDAAYFQAAIPQPYVIFGLRLLPLSIGRYRLLKRFGCGFVSEEETSATVPDLVIGLIICSMPCHEFLQFIEGPEFLPEIRRFGKRIRREMRSDPHFNILAKFGLFQRYITEQSQCPKYWNEREDEHESAAHWSHNMEIALRELGWSSHDIDEAPLSKALADYFKHAENQGAIRLMSQSEIEQGESNIAAFEAFTKGASCPASN